MKHAFRFKADSLILIILVLFLGLTLSACSQAPDENTPTLTVTTVQTKVPILTPTPRPSPTPTLPPLGMAGNPVNIGFVIPAEDTNRMDSAEDIAFLIGEDTGYAVQSLIFPDFSSLAEAIQEGKVHLFWLSPLEYLYLNGLGTADVLLMSNHLGVFAYGVQFFTNATNGFTPYFDPETGQSQGDGVDALQQFAGTRPCFLNPESLPGYYVPKGLLAAASTPTLEPVFIYDYSAIIRALYIRGICDFGVGYAWVGDPRTAGDILQDIPDAQDRVEVIFQSDAIIPNIGLAASPNLPLNMQVRLQEAFLDFASITNGLPLISNGLNYDVEALKVVTDDFYTPLRVVIAPLELDFEAITTQSRSYNEH